MTNPVKAHDLVVNHGIALNILSNEAKVGICEALTNILEKAIFCFEPHLFLFRINFLISNLPEIILPYFDKVYKKNPLTQKTRIDEILEKFKSQEPLNLEECFIFIASELPAFFNAVKIYQSTDAVQFLIETNVAPQDPIQAARLTLPKQLEENPPVDLDYSFSGLYTEGNLKKYLSSFQESIEKNIKNKQLAQSAIPNLLDSFCVIEDPNDPSDNPNELSENSDDPFGNSDDPFDDSDDPFDDSDDLLDNSDDSNNDPNDFSKVLNELNKLNTHNKSINKDQIICLKLRNINHAVLVWYDPCSNDLYLFNSHKIHALTRGIDNIAAAILESFGSNGFISFSTTISCFHDSKELVNNFMTDWKSTIDEIQKDSDRHANQKDTFGATQLLIAAMFGHFNEVIHLIGQGASINEQDNRGWTALHLAAQNGHFDIVKYLVEKGAIFNALTAGNVTPLWSAAASGHLELLKYLVQKGALINIAVDGKTPLYSAIEKGHLNVVKYLIEQGASLNALNDEQSTPLFVASQSGQLHIAQYFIEQDISLIDKQNKNGETPLLLAVRQGHLELARYLIAKGADIHKKDFQEKTPLAVAIENNKVEAVKLLVSTEKGDDFKLLDLFSKILLLDRLTYNDFIDELKLYEVRYSPNLFREEHPVTKIKNILHNTRQSKNLKEFPEFKEIVKSAYFQQLNNAYSNSIFLKENFSAMPKYSFGSII